MDPQAVERSWHRRWLRAGVAAVTLSLVVASRGSAETSFAPGRGAARALVVRAGPSQAGLAVAVNLAESMADFQGSVGRGSSITLQSGVLGLLVPDLVANLPKTTRVDSTEEASEDGRSHVFLGTPVTGASSQRAWATDDPGGRATTTLGVVDVPGLVSVGGGTSTARAGVVDGDERESHAEVDIPSIALLDGAVRLESLRWRTTQRSGPAFPDDIVEEGGFSVGRIVVAGQEIAAPDTPAEVAEAFAQLNAAIAPSGLVVDVPRIGRVGASTVVTPLVVRMAGSEVGRATVGPALGAAQPIREQVAAALLEQSPEAAAALLVADIAVGALSGAGGVTLEIGGVEASTDGSTYGNPFAGFQPRPLAPPEALGSTAGGPAAGAPVARSAPLSRVESPGAIAPSSPDGTATREHFDPVPVSSGDDPGPVGGLLAAGIVGTLAMAAGEWARGRRARFAFDEEG